MISRDFSGILGLLFAWFWAQKFTENLINSNASHIIYISCFPESLASDLSLLAPHFNLQDIVMVAQFPRTHHYEAAVLLQRV